MKNFGFRSLFALGCFPITAYNSLVLFPIPIPITFIRVHVGYLYNTCN